MQRLIYSMLVYPNRPFSTLFITNGISLFSSTKFVNKLCEITSQLLHSTDQILLFEVQQ